MSFEIMSHQIKELVHIFNLVRKIQKSLQKIDLFYSDSDSTFRNELFLKTKGYLF